MKKTVVMAFLAATIGLCASFAQAQTNSVYAIDSRGEVVMDPFGLCWRTGFWTPAAAAQDKNGCKCDKDLIAKEICEPKAAPVKAEPKKEAPKKAAFGEKVTIAADALFDFNKATLRTEGKAKLDELVGKAKAIKLEVILVVGHTDRIGGDAYNQKLSEKRAAAVKEYLVAKGIEANRVYTEGKGEKQPVTGDKCKGESKSKALIDCLQPDRRADIEIIGTK